MEVREDNKARNPLFNGVCTEHCHNCFSSTVESDGTTYARCSLDGWYRACGRHECPYIDATSIKDSGYRTQFDTGFVRDLHSVDGIPKGRMDLLPWNAILEVSRHCERGAAKYGEHNVDLGCPFHSLADSGARHLAKWIAGQDDEPHLVAAVWNLLWLLEQTITKPELNDMFWNRQKQERKEKAAKIVKELCAEYSSKNTNEQKGGE